MGDVLKDSEVCLEHSSPRSLHLESGWYCPVCVDEQMREARGVDNGEVRDGTG